MIGQRFDTYQFWLVLRLTSRYQTQQLDISNGRRLIIVPPTMRRNRGTLLKSLGQDFCPLTICQT